MGHFGINKTKNIVGLKYYWPSFQKDIVAYVKGYNVYLGSKTVRHKLYSDLQFLFILTHLWKDLLLDFIMRLPFSTNWKGKSYDFILVILDWLTKMVHYEPVKITINALGLVEVILGVVVWHYGLPNSIMFDKNLLFISMFWLSLCYFLGIKHGLSIAFYLQMDNQTK